MPLSRRIIKAVLRPYLRLFHGLELIAAGANVPIMPLGISGTFEAMPPGSIFPRPHKIVVRIGPTFRLARGTNAEAAAERIRSEIAAVLPPEMQPIDDKRVSSPS